MAGGKKIDLSVLDDSADSKPKIDLSVLEEDQKKNPSTTGSSQPVKQQGTSSDYTWSSESGQNIPIDQHTKPVLPPKVQAVVDEYKKKENASTPESRAINEAQKIELNPDLKKKESDYLGTIAQTRNYIDVVKKQPQMTAFSSLAENYMKETDPTRKERLRAQLEKLGSEKLDMNSFPEYQASPYEPQPMKDGKPVDVQQGFSLSDREAFVGLPKDATVLDMYQKYLGDIHKHNEASVAYTDLTLAREKAKQDAQVAAGFVPDKNGIKTLSPTQAFTHGLSNTTEDILFGLNAMSMNDSQLQGELARKKIRDEYLYPTKTDGIISKGAEMLGGVVPYAASSVIPGGALASAITGAGMMGLSGYGQGLYQGYIEAKQKGLSDGQALQQAKDYAKIHGLSQAALGAIMPVNGAAAEKILLSSSERGALAKFAVESGLMSGEFAGGQVAENILEGKDPSDNAGKVLTDGFLLSLLTHGISHGKEIPKAIKDIYDVGIAKRFPEIEQAIHQGIKDGSIDPNQGNIVLNQAKSTYDVLRKLPPDWNAQEVVIAKPFQEKIDQLHESLKEANTPAIENDIKAKIEQAGQDMIQAVGQHRADVEGTKIEKASKLIADDELLSAYVKTEPELQKELQGISEMHDDHLREQRLESFREKAANDMPDSFEKDFLEKQKAKEEKAAEKPASEAKETPAQETAEPVQEKIETNDRSEEVSSAKGDAEETRDNPGDAISLRERPQSETDAARQKAEEKIKSPETNQVLKSAQDYNKSVGLPEVTAHELKTSDESQQTKIAQIYPKLQDVNSPTYKEGKIEKETFEGYKKKYPEIIDKYRISDYKDLVKKSYKQLIHEVDKQFEKLPVKIEFHGGEKNYENSKEMLDDVHNHNHLWVFRGGEDHTELGSKTADKNGITANEKFRAVHDFYGHAGEGHPFGKNGEENAWIEHSKTFSPLAQWALSSETRGQNSWVNYSGENAEAIETIKLGSTLKREGLKQGNEEMIKDGEQLLEEGNSKFKFAEQKAVLIPQEYTDVSAYHKNHISEIPKQLDLSEPSEKEVAAAEKDFDSLPEGEQQKIKEYYEAQSQGLVPESETAPESGPDAQVQDGTDKGASSSSEGTTSEDTKIESEAGGQEQAGQTDIGEGSDEDGEHTSPADVTGARKEITDRELQDLGLDPIEREAIRKRPETFARAKEDVDSGKFNVGAFIGDRLAELSDGKQVHLTDYETDALTYHKAKLLNFSHELTKDISEAKANGDENMQKESWQKLSVVNDEFTSVAKVLKRGLSTAGRTLRSAKDEIATDYTYLGQMAQIKADHGEIPEATERIIYDQTAKIRELQQKFDDLLKKQTTRSTKANSSYSERAKIMADNIRKLKSKPFTFKDSNGNVFEVKENSILPYNEIIETVATLVEKGGEVADAIKEALDNYKDSDWYKSLSPSDREAMAEQLKEHLSGADELTPEQKQEQEHIDKLREELRDQKKRSDADLKDIKEQTKQILKEIADAEKAETKEKIKAELEQEVPDRSDEDKALQEESDRLLADMKKLEAEKKGQEKQEYKDLKKKQQEIEKQLAKAKEKAETPAVDKTKKEPTASDKQKDLANDTKKAEKKLKAAKQKVFNDKLKELRKKETEANRKSRDIERKWNALQQLQEDVAAGRKLEPKVQAKMNRLNTTLKKLKEIEQSGNYARQPKPVTAMTPDMQKIQAEINAAKDRIDTERAKLAYADRPKWQRAVDWIPRLNRFNILTSPKIIAKLMAAGTWQMAFTPIRKGIQTALGKTVLKDIASKAPTEGNLSVSALAKSYNQILDKAYYKDIPQTLKSGKSEIFNLGTDRKDIPTEPKHWTDYVNNSHAAAKLLPLRSEYYASRQSATEWAIREGLDLNDLATENFIHNLALDNASRNIFKSPNGVSQFYQSGIDKLKKSNMAGYAVGTILDVIFPVKTIPLNIVKDLSAYVGGGAAAFGRAKFEKSGTGLNTKIASRTSELTPEDADYIMRNAGKNLIGVMGMMAGYGLAHTAFGGLYHRGDKIHADDQEKESYNVKVGDHEVEVPGWLLHHPNLLGSMISADVRKQMEDAEKAGKPLDFSVALTKSIVSTVETVPFFSGPANLYEAARDKQDPAKKLSIWSAKEVRNIAEPSIMQHYAKEHDVDEFGNKIKRKEDSFMDVMKAGVPGVRESLPESMTLYYKDKVVNSIRNYADQNPDASPEDLMTHYDETVPDKYKNGSGLSGKRLKNIVDEAHLSEDQIHFKHLQGAEQEAAWNSLTPEKKEKYKDLLHKKNRHLVDEE